MKKIGLTWVFLTFFALNCYSLTRATQNSVVDAETLNIIDACATERTSFLKGKISHTSINQFLDYYSKNLSGSLQLPLAIISFTTPGETKAPSGWSIKTNVHYNHMLNRANNFVSWLKKNYTPKKDLIDLF